MDDFLCAAAICTLTVLVSKPSSCLGGTAGWIPFWGAVFELLCPLGVWLLHVTCAVFQIHIDIPRTNPLIPLFQQPLVQEVRGEQGSCPTSLWGQAVCVRGQTSTAPRLSELCRVSLPDSSPWLLISKFLLKWPGCAPGL